MWIVLVILLLILGDSYDDDDDIGFYWGEAAGNVASYNVYVYVSTDEKDYEEIEDFTLDHDLGEGPIEAPAGPSEVSGEELDLYYLNVGVPIGEFCRIYVVAVDLIGTSGPLSNISEKVWRVETKEPEAAIAK